MQPRPSGRYPRGTRHLRSRARGSHVWVTSGLINKCEFCKRVCKPSSTLGNTNDKMCTSRSARDKNGQGRRSIFQMRHVRGIAPTRQSQSRFNQCPEFRPARGSRYRAPSSFSWGARVNGAWCSAAPIPATWPSGEGNGRQAPRLQRERRKQQNNPTVGRVVVVGSQPSRSQAATTLSYDGKAPRPAYPLSVSHVRRLSRKPRSARHRASRASRSSTVSTPRDT